MQRDFIEDFFDHKARVVRYMRVAAHALSRHLIYFGNPVDHDETLIDMIDIACTKRRYPSQPIHLNGQLGSIFQNTVAWFASYKGDTDWDFRWYCISDLFCRAAEHDNSKFSSEEFSLFDQAFLEFQKYPYGSEELNAVYASIQPALVHHYQDNDHHPEHFPSGIADMHCVQLIEMCADWLASSERDRQNIFNEGLEINRKRFGIDDQLFPVLRNTIVALKEGNNL